MPVNERACAVNERTGNGGRLMNTTRYIAKCRTCRCHTSSLCSGQDMHRAKDDPRREGPGGL